MITGAAKVAGVVGWPVAHSLSPLIHNAWIEALGLDAVYVPFAVPPESFERFIGGMRGAGIAGANVTLPLKTLAFDLSDTKSDAASDAAAANLLVFLGDGSVLADNTDGFGLIDALECVGWRTTDGPLVILGAGGAATGALAALVRAGVQDVRLVARRREAALPWAESYPHRTTAFAFGDLPDALRGVVAVVNATSAGLNGVGELPPMDAAPADAVFMDMVYSPLRTPFLRAAAARGHPTVDGLAMLIGQARPSFEAFFGVPPPPREVIDVRALCLRALGEGP